VERIKEEEEEGEISQDHGKRENITEKSECMTVHTRFCMEELGNCTVQLR
jgi:hypothetical protein